MLRLQSSELDSTFEEINYENLSDYQKSALTHKPEYYILEANMKSGFDLVRYFRKKTTK